MTTFADMQAAVIANTKRPELVVLTDNAIRMATLRAHQVDFFPRDQSNVSLNYTPIVSGQIYVDYTTLYSIAPLIRTPDFMQSIDLVTGLPTENLEHVVDFKNFWNEYNELRSSCFTLLGANLRARSLSNTGKFQLYYYSNPAVDTIGYNSWIADMYKEELAMWAAAIVWMRSGFQEIAASAQRDAILPFKDLLVTSHLSSKV